IHADAEARLDDREAGTAAPSLGQAVALQEHVARLLEAAVRGVVDVVVFRRERRAVRVAREARGGEGDGVAGHAAIIAEAGCGTPLGAAPTTPPFDAVASLRPQRSKGAPAGRRDGPDGRVGCGSEQQAREPAAIFGDELRLL